MCRYVLLTGCVESGLWLTAGPLDELGRPGSRCHSLLGESEVAPVAAPGQGLGPAKLVSHRLGQDVVQVTEVGAQLLGPLFLEELEVTAPTRSSGTAL